MSDPLPGPRPCRLCSVPLLFARTAKGEVMPLDAKPTTVYVTTNQLDLLGKSELTLGDRVVGHAAHWTTCPYADKFRSPKPSSRARGEPD